MQMSIRNYVDQIVKNTKERERLSKHNEIELSEWQDPEVLVFTGIEALAYGAGMPLLEGDACYYFRYDDVLFTQIKNLEAGR